MRLVLHFVCRIIQHVPNKFVNRREFDTQRFYGRSDSFLRFDTKDLVAPGAFCFVQSAIHAGQQGCQRAIPRLALNRTDAECDLECAFFSTASHCRYLLSYALGGSNSIGDRRFGEDNNKLVAAIASRKINTPNLL
jgi:hypothetical protein